MTARLLRLARSPGVGQPNGSATVQDHYDWMAEELPFLAGQRPWARADRIAAAPRGSPVIRPPNSS